MLKKVKVLCVILILMFNTNTQSQNKLKSKYKITADELIYNYLNSTGGLKKWLNFKSVIFKGIRSRRTQSLSFTIYAQLPDKRRIEIPFKDHTIVQASDGETAWTINPFMGKGGIEARILEDKEAKLIHDRSEILPEFINYKKRGNKVSYEGETKLEGEMYHKLKVVKKNKNIKYFYFDKITYLIYMEESASKEAALKGNIQMFVREYTRIDGLQLPYIIEAMNDGRSLYVIQTDDIIVNPKLEDKLFKFPKK